MTFLFHTFLAQATTAPKGTGNMFTDNPMTIAFPLILVVMYFFMIRPQQKKAKDAQKFKETIDKGQKIVTIGGIHARIIEVKEKTFVIEVGGSTKMEIEKSAVSPELTKAVQNPVAAPVK
jgi:preprotein translocase subunit YajC